MEEKRTEKKVVQHPAEAEVGDYASVESLLRAGGRFYSITNYENKAQRAICELPTSTWELKDASDPGYQRIE